MIGRRVIGRRVIGGEGEDEKRSDRGRVGLVTGRMRHTSVLLALSLLAPLTLAASASAQDHAKQGRDDRSSEVQVMDFLDGDQVDGETVGPWEEILRDRRLGRRTTLIRARAHFQQEMLKSVENL